MKKNLGKKNLPGFAILGLFLAMAVYLFIPRTAIAPAADLSEVPLGIPVEISSSPLAKIAKYAVYANDQLVDMEYNLDSGDLARNYELRPGQKVRVEAYVSSPLGITREFTSSFVMISPVAVDSISVNGTRFSPGQKIPPAPVILFTFNKPVDQASASLDGGDPVELSTDTAHPNQAVLTPAALLQQGSAHVLKLTAKGKDSSELIKPLEIRMPVAKPLFLYGKVDSTGEQARIEMDASVAFRDSQAVKNNITTTLPGAKVSVEPKKIIITADGLDRTKSYYISVGSAMGIDDSFLEKPLALTLAFSGEQIQIATGGLPSSYAVQSYAFSNAGTEDSTPAGQPQAPAARSGPPPGWPPCCPWPPR